MESDKNIENMERSISCSAGDTDLLMTCVIINRGLSGWLWHGPGLIRGKVLEDCKASTRRRRKL